MTPTKKTIALDDNAERLSTGIPTRLYQADHERLKDLEKIGLNMSLIIRKCVQRALPEVAAEIVSGITRSVKKA